MQIKGTVDKTFFRNEDSGYAVILLRLEDGGAATLQGPIAGMREGAAVVAEAEQVMTKYGQQLRVSRWDECRPADVDGVEKYLASGLIKNIGPVLAHQIVEAFGMDTLDILDHQPERLAEVRGIGRKRVASIIEAVKEQTQIRSIMIWLKRYDLPNGMSAKIYKTYGQDSVRVLEENPYRLADEIKGVGFKKADQVALLVGLERTSLFRMRSGLLHAVKDFTDTGSTYMPKDLLLETASGDDYLGLPREVVEEAFTAWMATPGSRSPLVVDGNRVYPSLLYHAERKVAARLLDLSRKEVDLFCEDPDGLGEFDIHAIEGDTGVSYNRQQERAIRMAASGGVLVLTGGPGTGKTVTTNGIIRAFEKEGKRVLLCAPTGRAAKRMAEVSGREAMTVHRLLGYGQDGFSFNEDCPLQGDALIMDESSMVDILLMSSLLAAVPKGMTVVLVGDVDQLPSVGSGSVLRDIIDSGAVPTVRLTEIYRQAQGSAIIMGAHAVNGGRMPDLSNQKGTDLFFIEREDAEKIADTIVHLVTKHFPEKLGVPAGDIQVLSPMRRQGDIIGITCLNDRLQQELNPDGYGVSANGRVYREGDRVMQVRNDYDKNVFNGDTGRIVSVSRVEDEIDIDFQGTIVPYTKAELKDIELAYASTVHKSQGSEYPVVIIPVHKSHFILLRRNLLYTGITRAKRMCVLVGTKAAVAMAVSREDTESRYSGLVDRLRERF